MKELELTREELRKSSEAQQKSEKALSEQVAQMEKSSRLNALSALLDHHNKALEASNNGFSTVTYSVLEEDRNNRTVVQIYNEIKKLANINHE